MRRIVKMYEDFSSEESHDFYDKDEIYIDLKSSSEEILKVIGFEKETEWFEMLNDLAIAKTEEEFHAVMGEIEEFLREYKKEENISNVTHRNFDEHNLHPYSRVGGRSFTSIAPPGGRDFE